MAFIERLICMCVCGEKRGRNSEKKEEKRVRERIRRRRERKKKKKKGRVRRMQDHFGGNHYRMFFETFLKAIPLNGRTGIRTKDYQVFRDATV